LLYQFSKSELKIELQTTAALALLNSYEKMEDISIHSFVYSVMKNHIYVKFTKSIAKKRDVRKNLNFDREDIGLKDVLSVDAEEYNKFNDPDFISTFCSFWKTNGKKYFSSPSMHTLLFIIDIIEHPENHDISGWSFSNYIQKEKNMSRQRLHFILNKMKKISRHIKY
jgi:hypothetical protein